MRGIAIKLFALLKRVSPAEKRILLGIPLTAGFLYAFAELADEMVEGETRGFDTAVLLAFRDKTDISNPLGPAWLEGVMRDFTALGGFPVLTVITLAVFGFLLLTAKRHAAWMVLFSVTCGALLSHLLKWGFSRPRPDLVPHGTMVFSPSFPSGHAMLSAVVYLTLGALLARTQTEPRVKIYLLAVAAALTTIVGVSRVYLGVHWPTDVLAGWALGSAWSLVCWLIMVWLQARGTVERPAKHD